MSDLPCLITKLIIYSLKFISFTQNFQWIVDLKKLIMIFQPLWLWQFQISSCHITSSSQQFSFEGKNILANGGEKGPKVGKITKKYVKFEFYYLYFPIFHFIGFSILQRNFTEFQSSFGAFSQQGEGTENHA